MRTLVLLVLPEELPILIIFHVQATQPEGLPVPSGYQVSHHSPVLGKSLVDLQRNLEIWRHIGFKFQTAHGSFENRRYRWACGG